MMFEKRSPDVGIEGYDSSEVKDLVVKDLLLICIVVQSTKLISKI